MSVGVLAQCSASGSRDDADEPASSAPPSSARAIPSRANRKGTLSQRLPVRADARSREKYGRGRCKCPRTRRSRTTRKGHEGFGQPVVDRAAPSVLAPGKRRTRQTTPPCATPSEEKQRLTSQTCHTRSRRPAASATTKPATTDDQEHSAIVFRRSQSVSTGSAIGLHGGGSQRCGLISAHLRDQTL